MADSAPDMGAQIVLAETPDFDLGGLRVTPARRQVGMNGQAHDLEPRIAQVLVALASARPRVVSRDRLVDQCWGGRIVGDDTLNRCIVALRQLAKEYSPEPFAIETVRGVGYCLVERPGAERSDRHRISARAWAVALVFALALAGAAAWIMSDRAQAAPATIAVLPFRNLAAGDAYFAEGVGEEILAQLTREPAFRVAGPASAAQFAGEPDVRKVGRSLGVDYVLQGSVRPDGDRVRVNAALVQTRDGMRLWSETYDRKLDDILAIQSAIGQAVASGLKRRLVHSGANDSRPVNGKAYALYLSARGLLRSDNPQSGQEAVELLKEAVRLDPSFAAAWSSLAQALELNGATKGSEGMVAIIPEAQAAARRALQLDPNLVDAHGTLGRLLGDDRPEGFGHLKRAAELEPRSAEGLLRRSAAFHVGGQFEQALGAIRLAHQADPLWQQPMRAFIDDTIELADRATAEAAVKAEIRDDPDLLSFALARVALFAGDYSEAARRWSSIAEGQSRWSGPSKGGLDKTLTILKLSDAPPTRAPLATIGQNRFALAVANPKTPSPAEWRLTNRSPAATLVYQDSNSLAAKLILQAGRADDLVATYDSPTGLLGIRRGVPINICYVRDAATVALALREVGRGREADALLAQADAVVRAAGRQGRVPKWFDEDAAGIWAVQGKPDLAIAALERALRRGWMHTSRTDLARLSDEPAFRSLRGRPRFEALQAKYDAHFARERRETAQVLKLAA
jgi:TolB-like protein/DNA-binding winged helix-turn-helix (wHTH) protein